MLPHKRKNVGYDEKKEVPVLPKLSPVVEHEVAEKQTSPKTLLGTEIQDFPTSTHVEDPPKIPRMRTVLSSAEYETSKKKGNRMKNVTFFRRDIRLWQEGGPHGKLCPEGQFPR